MLSWTAEDVLHYSRNPSLAGLDGEEGAHGVEDVVVVEGLPLPHALVHLGRVAGVADHEKGAPFDEMIS